MINTHPSLILNLLLHSSELHYSTNWNYILEDRSLFTQVSVHMLLYVVLVITATQEITPKT